MKRLSKIGMVILSICILMLGGCAGQEPEPTPGQTENQATPVEKEPVLQEMDWTSQFEGLEVRRYCTYRRKSAIWCIIFRLRREGDPPALPLKSLRLQRRWTKRDAECPEDSTRKWSGEKFWEPSVESRY